MDVQTVLWLRDYAGIVVGVVLLALAVSVLPGRVRWYVLSAGLAVLGYEAYLRYSNRQLLQQADAERARLQGELGKLEGERQALEQVVAELHRQQAELHNRQAALAQRQTALAQEGGDLAARRQALESEADALLRQSDELLARVGSNDAILQKLARASHAAQQLEGLGQ